VAAGLSVTIPVNRFAAPRILLGMRAFAFASLAVLCAPACTKDAPPSPPGAVTASPSHAATAPAAAPTAPTTAPAPAPAAPSPAADPIGQQVLANAKDGLAAAQALAEQEHADADKRLQQLDQTIRDVEALIDAGQLDRAEIRAASVRWQPDPTRSMISDTDAELIKQYDDRRETLMRVIRRKRAATTSP
jgi:hypothetical protein